MNEDSLTVPGPPADGVPAFDEQATAAARRRRLLLRAASLFGPLEEEALGEIDREAEWVSLRRGDVLMREGDAGDSLLVLLAGRLQVTRQRDDGTAGVIGEAGCGETIGEMAFFSGEPRSATVWALRDSLLVRFSREAFERLIARRPHVLRQVTRIQVERLRRANDGRPHSPRVVNVAVVPLTAGVASPAFCRRLASSLGSFGSTLHLTAADVDRFVGTPRAADAPAGGPDETRLLAWLGEREVDYRFVVLEAAAERPEWCARAIRQADRILLLANAAGCPDLSEVERRLLPPTPSMAGARRTLVLLHGDNVLPAGTRAWLAPRSPIEHYHVRDHEDADVARLARFLAGRAVGLALGGGGARGFAHIGLMRALVEANVPIDMVGGTSMGAAMAAQHAMGWSPGRMIEVNHLVWNKIRPHREFTLPLLSLVRSDGAERCGRMMYGDTQIEDLWIPYFCVSSNLTTATMKVHRQGSLLRAVTASSSLPGIVVPVLEDQQLLGDGALFNNLPGDVMRELGCGQVMVSRVSVEADDSFRYERIPTLGEVIRAALSPLRRRPRYPGLVEVVMRAAILASVNRENQVARDADVLFQPPIDRFGLMEFGALDAIVECGYAHARERLDAWSQEGGRRVLTADAEAETAVRE